MSVGAMGSSEERRTALGAVALVCCTWRDAAQHERLWASLVKALIPRLAADGMTMAKAELKKGGRMYRKDLVEYGRFLRQRRVLTLTWDRGLVLKFDIWDYYDEWSIFSLEGVAVTELGDDGVTMSVDGLGSSFSPASCTDGHEVCNSMFEYLVGLMVGVRITVHDTYTGRKALLWNGKYRGNVTSENVADEYLVSSVAMPLTTVSFGLATLKAAVEFRVEADTDAEELDSTLPDTRKMWRGTRATYSFKTFEYMEVGRLVWSALGY